MIELDSHVIKIHCHQYQASLKGGEVLLHHSRSRVYYFFNRKSGKRQCRSESYSGYGGVGNGSEGREKDFGEMKDFRRRHEQLCGCRRL
jgi:hypothetical protein